MTSEPKEREERIVTSKKFKIIGFAPYIVVFFSLLPINVLLYGFPWGLVFTLIVIPIYVFLFELSTVEQDWAFSIPEDVLKDFTLQEKILLVIRPLLFSVLLRIFLIGSLELIISLSLAPIIAIAGLTSMNAFVERVLYVLGSLTAVSGILTAVFRYFESSGRRISYILDSIAAQIVLQLSEVLSFSNFSDFIRKRQQRGDKCAKKVFRYVIEVEANYPKEPALLRKYLKELKRDPERILKELWRRAFLDKNFQGFLQLEERVKAKSNEEEKEEVLGCLDELYGLYLNSREVREDLEKLRKELEQIEEPLEKPVKKAVLESLWIIPPLFSAEEPFVYYNLLEELSERKLIFYSHLKALLEEYFPSLFKFLKQNV